MRSGKRMITGRMRRIRGSLMRFDFVKWERVVIVVEELEVQLLAC